MSQINVNPPREQVEPVDRRSPSGLTHMLALLSGLSFDFALVLTRLSPMSKLQPRDQAKLGGKN